MSRDTKTTLARIRSKSRPGAYSAFQPLDEHVTVYQLDPDPGLMNWWRIEEVFKQERYLFTIEARLKREGIRTRFEVVDLRTLPGDPEGP